MRSIHFKLTRPQYDFFQLDAKFPAFVGGFGTGKTETLVCAAIRDALEAKKGLIALYEPSYDLVDTILVPRLAEKLADFGIRFKYNAQKKRFYCKHCADFILRTLDNPARIVGYESYRAHIDELDTLTTEKAEAVWQKIIARNREIPRGLVAVGQNRVSVYTTPEGFRFVYMKWAKDPLPDYKMIQAPTTSNPFLPKDYVDTLLSSYPVQLRAAYISGKFVNLTSGAVYPDFDRALNGTDERIRPGEPLHIGVDFNVGKMSAVVWVIRNSAPMALDEIVGGRDTPAMVDTILERFRGHSITVYPDASGANTSSKGASLSDIAIIRQAGLAVKAKKANPRIKDRVNAVNALILNAKCCRRLLVNTAMCPHLTDSLEKQCYDKTGMPDKTAGLDHVADAAGYPLAWLYPVKKPTVHISNYKA